MKSRRERTVADRRETTVERGNGGVADAENAAVGGEDGSVGDAGEVMIEDEVMTAVGAAWGSWSGGEDREPTGPRVEDEETLTGS